MNKAIQRTGNINERVKRAFSKSCGKWYLKHEPSYYYNLWITSQHGRIWKPERYQAKAEFEKVMTKWIHDKYCSAAGITQQLTIKFE